MTHTLSTRAGIAVVAIGSLVAAGLVTFGPTSAAPALPIGDDAEFFHVSQTDAGVSSQPYLTPDSQRVFFTSTASNLVPGDDNGVADVFVSTAVANPGDPFSGPARLVSAPTGPVGAIRANGPSGEAAASADGRYVVFTSSATNLVPAGGTPGRTHVYFRDMLLGTTIRLQAPLPEPNASSREPDISDDGRVVVFTSDATNLSTGDSNGMQDVFYANMDANGDGVLGDYALTRVYPDNSLPTGSWDPAISGNGTTLVFLTRSDPKGTDPNPAATPTIVVTTKGDWSTYGTMGDNASELSIDATGSVVAFIDGSSCDGVPHIVAQSISGAAPFTVALGTVLVETRTGGWVADPAISADGSTVVWTTTRPQFSFAGETPALEHPVVRSQAVQWWDAPGSEVECSGVVTHEWIDVAEGADASISASGRSIAFATPDATPSRVQIVDTHSNDGISVTSVQGTLPAPGYMTSVDIASIPIAALRGYAAALADAPVYRLPVYRLPVYRLPVYRLPVYRLLVDDSPVYRLPVYRLPVYRLPVYRLDLPGGWAQVLEGSPYSGDLIQTVTLDEVRTWANDQFAPGANPTQAQLAAAERIRSLTLSDIGIEDSGLDALSLASYLLGGAPLAGIPIAGSGANLTRWSALLDGQGLDVPLDARSVLAEVDSAGLDIARSGIDAVALSDLPIDDTLLGELRVTSSEPGHGLFLTGTPLGAIKVSDLTSGGRDTLFGPGAVSGTLASPSRPILAAATGADLAHAVPATVTFGEFLFSVLDSESYPWEQISPASFHPDWAETITGWETCQDGSNLSCDQSAIFRYTFDAGPGEPTEYAAPTASVTVPAGTRNRYSIFTGSGPDVVYPGDPVYRGPIQTDGRLVRYPLPDTLAGTMIEIETAYSTTTQPGTAQATAELTVGSLSASASRSIEPPLTTFDAPANNLVDGDWHSLTTMLQEGKVYYEWISPQYFGYDEETQTTYPGPADDSDYYLVRAPDRDERLVVSTNATDGQILLSLYAPTSASSATLGVSNAGPAPGTAVTEQTAQGAPAEAGADAGVDLPGQTLIDQAVVRGGGTADVEAAAIEAAADDRLVLRVTSGNGKPSSSLYSLRVRYMPEPTETTCLSYAPAADGVQGTSQLVGDATNTIYIMDTYRYGQIHGAADAEAVRGDLSSLTVDGGTVQGAILSVDADLGVRTARAALDQNPCSMTARAALTAAINRYVSTQIGTHRDQITSVVVVGGDDVIPLAPVAQHTAQFTEAVHAGDLRLPVPLAGGSCPTNLAEGVADPCETPLSAAARGSFILSDDPYALAQAYESLGGYLYVPSVGIGRLTGDADEIDAIVARFTQSGGVLHADSTTTAGYGAWSELPEQVTTALDWRSSSDEQFPAEWTKQLIESSVFPTGGAQSARVVSINTHADETRLLPGIPGAETGKFGDQDLFTAAGHTDAPQLNGALVFLIGCHAGNNLPTGYYGGGAVDWVDVFSAAGGYVGNTGFGLANNVTTALSERLLALYADWAGVTVDGRIITAAEALAYAKQSYLGGLGLYSGYDEKVLMQAVYYGLPMYSFIPGPTVKNAPLPEIPPSLGDVDTHGPLTASLSLDPTFTTQPAVEAGGRAVQYMTANGQYPMAVAGQPVLPQIVSQLAARPNGFVPRGAVLTQLTSEVQSITPAIAEPDVGVGGTNETRPDIAFPSSFAAITTQETPDGPVDLLVVTPARVQASADGTGTIETFTHLDLEVTYGPAGSDDVSAPVLEFADLSGRGGSLRFRPDDGSDGSGIKRMVLLVQRAGESDWENITVSAPGTGQQDWTAPMPAGAFRWILQIADNAGNVATETARGHLDAAQAPAPTFGDAGGDATIGKDERVTRSIEVRGLSAQDRASGAVTVTAKGSPEITAAMPTIVETGADGITRSVVDVPFATPGEYTVTLQVCRGESCGSTSFDVSVRVGNGAPSASVVIQSGGVVSPTSTLTAVGAGSDPDHDSVSLSYSWSRNGANARTGATLNLAEIGAVPGDVIGVRVVPNDGKTDGHAASASVVVVAAPTPPQITVSAVNAAGAYAAGSWSRSTVVVSFTCTAGSVPLLSCSGPQTVSGNTLAAGTLITGTATDVNGSVPAGILVRVDKTAPTLAPTVTPNPVPVGGTATAAPNPSDTLSGILPGSASCTQPVTATPGDYTVSCTAADVAGNTTTVLAPYTVTAPPTTCLRGEDRRIMPPVNADGTSVFARLSAVPVIFKVCDSKGKPVGTAGLVKSVTQTSAVTLPGTAKVNELPYLLPTVKPTYIKLTGTWVGSIGSLTLATGKKYTYKVTLTDGTTFTFTFGIR